MDKTTPKINYSYYQKKCKELDDSINSKKEKNIAISGIYGSGKSSLIQTYDRIFNNKKFKDKEFIKKIKKFTRTNTDSSSNKTNLNSHQHKTKEDKDTALQEIAQDKLNSYLEDLPYKAKKKSLTISLANFNIINDKQLENEESENTNQSPIDLSNQPESQEEVDEKDKISLELLELDQYNKQRKSQYYNKNKQLIEQRIEQSLLQQFLFSVDSRKLPESKVKRVTQSTVYSKITYISLCFVLLSVGLYLINFFSVLWQQSRLVSSILILFGVMSLISFFCFLPLAFKIKSFKLQDLEFIKADPDIKDSLINRYIDEIIYFFEKSGVEIVFFEDLDRLPDLSIFNKLRELNFILNNTFKNKKRKISFVYCISDSIITDYEERSKFFDKIISLEPFFTEATAINEIEKLLNESGIDQGTIFATDMAKFIPDKRLYVNIKDDFRNKFDTFLESYKREPNKTEIIKMFAISVYKNIYYFDYNKFNTGKSCLSKAFSLIGYLKNDYIKNIKTKINELNEKIESSNYDNNADLEILKERIAGIIQLKNSSSYRRGQFVAIKDMKVSDEFSKDTYFGINTNMVLSYDDLDVYFKGKYKQSFSEIISNIKLKQQRYRNEIENEKNKLQEQINSINKIPVSEFMKISDCSLIKNDFIYTCLINGYISGDYLKYVFFNKADILKEEELEFVRLNNYGENSPARGNYIYKLNQEALPSIVNKILLEKYSTENILNYDLINFLYKPLKNSQKDVYSGQKIKLTEYLMSKDKPLYNFYCEFLLENGKQEIKNLINFVYDSTYFLTAFKDDLNKLETAKQNFILNCLLEQDFENMSDNNKSTLLEILNKHTNWENIELSANLIDRLKSLGKLQIETFDGLSEEYSKSVIDKICFAINYKNLNFISQKLLKNNDENNILLSFLNDDNSDSCKTYIFENIDNVLECLSNSPNLNETAIKDLLNNNLISDESKQLIIEKCNFEIKDIYGIDKKYIGLIIQNDKLAYDIETIFEVFINYEDFDLYGYFNTENYPKLNLANKNNILDNENYKQFKEFLIENLLLTDNAVKIFKDFNINEIELDTNYETNCDSKLLNLIKRYLINFSVNNFNHLINCYNAYFELLKQNEEEYIKLIENSSTTGLYIDGEILSYILSKTTNSILQTFIIDNLSNLLDIEFKYNGTNYASNILLIIKDKKLNKKDIIIKLFNFMDINNLKEQRLELLENNNNLLTTDELILCLKRIGQDFKNCDVIGNLFPQNNFIKRGLKLLKDKNIINHKKYKDKYKMTAIKNKS